VISFEKAGSSYEELKSSLTGPVQYVYMKHESHFLLSVYTSEDATSLLKAKSAVHKRALGELLPVFFFSYFFFSFFFSLFIFLFNFF